jgi:hypothetical protein
MQTLAEFVGQSQGPIRATAPGGSHAGPNAVSARSLLLCRPSRTRTQSAARRGKRPRGGRDRNRREAATLGPAHYDQPQTRIRVRTRISSPASRVLACARNPGLVADAHEPANGLTPTQCSRRQPTRNQRSPDKSKATAQGTSQRLGAAAQPRRGVDREQPEIDACSPAIEDHVEASQRDGDGRHAASDENPAIGITEGDRRQT